MTASPKSKSVDIALCLFLGIFGAHRFYEGKFVTGGLYALSLGGLGVGAIADLLQILLGVRTDKNGRSIGKPGRLPRRLTKALSIAFAAAIIVSLGWALFNQVVNGSVVGDTYYDETDVSMPLETEYTALGPWDVDEVTVGSDDTLFKTFKIWLPAEADSRADLALPAVVVANGSGTPFFRFEPVFKHLASWGFIVIGNDDPDSGNGRSSTLALDYLVEMNDDPQSELYQRVDIDRIGIAGHSQGGAAAIRAATSDSGPIGFASLFTASTPSLALIKDAELSAWTYDTAKVRVPYFSVAGTGEVDAETIAPLTSMRENFDAVPDGVPAVMARRDGADHGDMLTWADGYMTAWFRYTLMGDDEAEQVFIGPDAEITRNESWIDVDRKSLDE
ncbi:pimeloyl-ACP methyl ester carboxylesterase [Microbacterium sp. ZKA21]|uniref:NINE protein n=1 Tax=Microbacterium sp. ZKA21 TaxID=3381694 RepID=UPI003D1F42A9